MNPELCILAAHETWPLRQKILRPHQTLEEMFFPGDEAVDTIHFGIVLDDAIAGIASLYREAHPAFPGEALWRLRGMAVDEAARRHGLGRRLVEECIAAARARGGTVLWCNARTSAADFYRRLGFKIQGKVFAMPGIGWHYLMWIGLQDAEGVGGSGQGPQ
ncbi:MAG: GNAT family N-acetyltransferase [Candidatus Hydrogenedentes bacterium]|nr:GNAT family N-acetyltransferase [Candidatus Hydrogenedentota bacterium]